MIDTGSILNELYKFGEALSGDDAFRFGHDVLSVVAVELKGRDEKIAQLEQQLQQVKQISNQDDYMTSDNPDEAEKCSKCSDSWECIEDWRR